MNNTEEDLEETVSRNEHFTLKEFIEEVVKNNEIQDDLDASEFILGPKKSKYKKLLGFFLVIEDIEINDKIIESTEDLIIVLRLFKTIKFNKCIFRLPLDESLRKKSETSFISDTEINGSKIFIGCQFDKKVFILGHQKNNEPNGTSILFDNDIFENCIFKENVVFEGVRKLQQSMVGPTLHRSALVERHEVQEIFMGCDFQGEVALKSLIFFCAIDSFMKENCLIILDVNNCIFNASFKLNNFEKIDEITIKNSEFNKKFEFKNSKVNTFTVDNTNFKKVSDFFKSEFKNFILKKSIFEDFAAFEGCIFATEATVFEYVTFKSFSNFRGSQFECGLDIEKANFAQPPNFLNANVPLENTPRETFRLIKHSFDSVGNHIEANKFFAFEMDKKRQSVPICEFNGVVYWLNYLISNFGQNYWRPFFLLVIIAIATAVYFPKTEIKKVCSESLSFFDEVACSIFPLKPILLPGNEFWSLVIAVLSSILIWQIIISVKRLTRR